METQVGGMMQQRVFLGIQSDAGSGNIERTHRFFTHGCQHHIQFKLGHLADLRPPQQRCKIAQRFPEGRAAFWRNSVLVCARRTLARVCSRVKRLLFDIAIEPGWR